MTRPVLRVEIDHALRGLHLQVKFWTSAPWTVLFGPSGTGKTTVLRSIQGFFEPRFGEIAVGDQTVFDAGTGTRVRPDLRPVRSAGQTPQLFDRLSLRDNLRYGSGWRLRPIEEAALCDEISRMFGLDSLAGHAVDRLSGGERQRVSVARAVVAAGTRAGTEPTLLLLDEPFSGQDLASRDPLMLALRDWLRERKVPVLSVSHDISEAFLLQAEVVRMSEGTVVAQGPAERVLGEERRAMLRRLGAAAI